MRGPFTALWGKHPLSVVIGMLVTFREGAAKRFTVLGYGSLRVRRLCRKLALPRSHSEGWRLPWETAGVTVHVRV